MTGSVCGIVLAAGGGTRYGYPKALARNPDGTPWVALAVDTLLAAGCDPVFVLLGARREEAAALVPEGARVVPVAGWADGLSGSLRCALAAAAESDAVAALLIPVDTPDLPAEACRRLLRSAGPGSLTRADYRGEPGHPVLIGRSHWRALENSVSGDQGASPFLRDRGVRAVECSDLWHGGDIDAPGAHGDPRHRGR